MDTEEIKQETTELQEETTEDNSEKSETTDKTLEDSKDETTPSKEETTSTEETQEKPKEESTPKERKLVIPGEIIVSAEDHLPGDFTRNEDGNIIANRYGLAETSGRVVRIIPISGVFEPRRGNTVIGRVDDINFSGWSIHIGGPYNAFLPLMECPRFINRNNIDEFATVGDVLTMKVLGVKRGSVDLTLKSRGLGKLEGGRVIKINPHKVPRVIGKEGSMINMIKDSSGTEITVGQNGFIWLRGSTEGERKAEAAIDLISKESTASGLTDKVEEFLKNYEGDKE
jgi:exosome complex component RRP4